MIGFVDDIEKRTLENTYFRQVIFTGQHIQLVVMSIPKGGEIGLEVHETTDQFLRIEQGVGKVIMNGEEHEVKEGSAFTVPAGTKHNVINTSENSELKLYTVYSPPHHKDGTIHKTKDEAESDKEDKI